MGAGQNRQSVQDMAGRQPSCELHSTGHVCVRVSVGVYLSEYVLDVHLCGCVIHVTICVSVLVMLRGTQVALRGTQVTFVRALGCGGAVVCV